MNWQAVSAVAEVVGVVAIVVSLIYLAIQIRQNTKVARAATRQAISDSTENLGSDLLNNREIAEILVRDINGDPLSAVESLRLQARCYRDMQHWENIFYQYNEGLVSADQWAGFRKNLVALLDINAYREYWEHEASHYSKAFQAEMSSVITESSAKAADSTIVSRFQRSTSAKTS